MAISVPSASGGEDASASEPDPALPADPEEEEEEEEEPQLLYQRAASDDIVALLRAESVSAVALSGKLIALGMRSGALALLDASGKLLRRLPAHRGAVNDVSFDAAGQFVGSASEDGQVAVASVSGDERVVYDYSAAVKSLSLDPGYAAKKSRQLACGGLAGQLVLNSKGWMGVRDHVLHSGEGPVCCVRWCGALIAWANDVGVKLYDSGAHTRIAFVDRPAGSPPPDAFPPRLVWESEKTLIIAWADCVKVARISVRGIRPEEAAEALEQGMVGGLGPACVTVVDVVACFQTDCYLQGVAPFSPGRLLLLAQQRGRVPEVRLVTWGNEEVSADALALRGHLQAGAGQLLLAWTQPPGAAPPAPLGGCASGPAFWAPEEAPAFLVAGPCDLVAARPRDVAAHTAWLAHQGRFGEALDACDAAEAARVPGAAAAARAAGDAWLGALLHRRAFAAAAALCPRLLRGDGEAWEAAAFRFAAAGGLPCLARTLPTQQPQLRQGVYEMTLLACVASQLPEDHAALAGAVRAWPARLYAPQALAAALRGRVAQLLADAAAAADEGCVTGTHGGQGQGPACVAAALREALAEVLQADGQVTAAALLLLELGSPSALPLIAHHRLLGCVADRVPLLALLDPEAVAPLLVEERQALPPGAVVAQLRGAPGEPQQRLLQRYLAELHEAEAAAAQPWAALSVDLTARFAPQALMGLLASSTSYPLEQALAAAARAGLVREQVFVLGRMGDARRALGLILDAMGDVEQALEFVQGQADARLWEELVARAGAAPALAGVLLERIGSATDARPLIAALPADAHIERLRERLCKLLADVRAQAALWHGCSACLRADAVAGSRALYAGATRAMRPQAVRWTASEHSA